MRNGVKKYLKEVRDLFPAYTNEEDVFYKKLENNILNEMDYEKSTYKDCVERFGNPRDIVIDFYDEMEAEYLLKRIKKVNAIKLITKIFITCLIIVSIIWIYIVYKDYTESKKYRIDSYEEVIEEIE